MLVETNNLTKVYHETITACEEICLSLEEGQVFGLLGPNGAGKSTLVKMLLGLTRPTSGQALIKGQPVNLPTTRKSIGYLPELFRLYEWLTAEELLRFYAGIYGIPVHKQNTAIMEALELVGLNGREKEKIKGYSKGMQQRLALAGAILHHPELLFLDEPTSALDPIGRRDVRDLVATLKQRGTTIFLNSHLLSEVEMTCTHLGFIKKGKLVACGETSEFLQDTHIITVEADGVDPALLQRWREENRLVEAEGRKLSLTVDNRTEVPLIVGELVHNGASIYNVESKSRGLEEVFLDLIES
jgi:ABC-2 type transport system ATP-binding protein